MKAILFDLCETLVIHLDPDFVYPIRTIAERLRIEESIYLAVWPNRRV